VYRILTEYKNFEGVVELLKGLGMDFTSYPALGSWKNESEKTLIIELEHPHELVYTAARRIAELNNQEAVMVQHVDTDTTFVSRGESCTPKT
jgi:hypothetical protein